MKGNKMKNKLFKKRLKEAFRVLLEKIVGIPVLWLGIALLFLLIPIVFIPFLITSFFATLFPQSIFWERIGSFFEFIFGVLSKLLEA